MISGVSIGAVNGFGMSLFSPEEDEYAAAFLKHFWEGLSKEVLYQNWPGGYMEALLERDSLYDNSIFFKYMDKLVKEKTIKRKISVGATDAIQGTFVRYNESLSFEDMVTAVRASSAFPSAFPPVNFDNRVLIDGGVISNLDIAGAIQRCREEVESDEDIVIDAILCTGASIEEMDVKSFNPVQIGLRALEITKYQETMGYVEQIRTDYPRVNLRYVVAPKDKLPSGALPIKFDQDAM